MLWKVKYFDTPIVSPCTNVKLCKSIRSVLLRARSHRPSVSIDYAWHSNWVWNPINLHNAWGPVDFLWNSHLNSQTNVRPNVLFVKISPPRLRFDGYWFSDGSKIMKWGHNMPSTFKNGGPWNITAAIIFELWITVKLCLDFQRGIVPHNFHVCVAFLKTLRKFCNATL